MPMHLSPEEIAQLLPAESSMFASPIPTQSVSSEEFAPAPQTVKQKEFEARIKQYGDDIAPKLGLTRRRFFQSASGMAAAFLAMNDTFGPVFGVSKAEAQTPDQAAERAKRLSGQFIMDMHTHFLRDDTRLVNFVRSREAVGQAGWNPALVGKPQTLDDLKFANYFKEVFMDSDTKIALVSGSPSHVPVDWFLTNQMKVAAREKINTMAGGTKRAMSHIICTPGVPGAFEKFERELAETKPDSWKGYTIGDNTNKPEAPRYAWRMDDEKVAYPYYERCAKVGLKNICVHKGLFPPATEKQFPNLLGYANVADVAKAAKDWPQLNFIIYHSAYRFAAGGDPADAWDQVQRTGRVDWVSDLADIPSRFGVNNVYGDLGQIFAQSTMVNPNLAAFMMGTLVKGLGVDRVVWGTDAIWTGSPQWQIESLRRLEIPEDMQRKYGFKPLGDATGAIKSAIFGGNNARLYNITPAQVSALETDKFVEIKKIYEQVGEGRTNLAYGYIAPKS
jgi:uncharacterized protein